MPETTWLNPRYIILSQRNQIPKYMVLLMHSLKTGKINLCYENQNIDYPEREMDRWLHVRFFWHVPNILVLYPTAGYRCSQFINWPLTLNLHFSVYMLYLQKCQKRKNIFNNFPKSSMNTFPQIAIFSLRIVSFSIRCIEGQSNFSKRVVWARLYSPSSAPTFPIKGEMMSP